MTCSGEHVKPGAGIFLVAGATNGAGEGSAAPPPGPSWHRPQPGRFPQCPVAPAAAAAGLNATAKYTASRMHRKLTA